MWLSMLAFILSILKLSRSHLDLNELKSVYYSIDISDTPLLQSDEIPEESVILSSKYGQLYQCTYPPLLQLPETHLADKEPEKTDVVVLLSPMKSLDCLFYTKGWWTYEFCYGREIKQFHAEDGKIVGEVILLGVYESDRDLGDTSNNKNRQFGKSVQVYHSQSYVNGSFCELTGRPRDTEVRFLCHEGISDTIASVDERETCSYIVAINTNRICSHPLFAPHVSTKSLSISCNPVLSPADYDIYIQDLPSESAADKSAVVDDVKGTDSKSAVDKKGTSSVEGLLMESLIQSVQEMLSQRVGNAQNEGKYEVDKISEDFVSDDTEIHVAKDANTDAESSSDPNVASDSSDIGDAGAHVDAHELTEDKVKQEEEEEGKKEKGTEEGVEHEDPPDEDDKEFLDEFESGLDEMDLTDRHRADIADKKETLSSQMKAQFGDIVQEAQEDMARQGDDVGDIDTDDAFQKLTKTLNGLLERLEKVENGVKNRGPKTEVDPDSNTPKGDIPPKTEEKGSPELSRMDGTGTPDQTDQGSSDAKETEVDKDTTGDKADESRDMKASEIRPAIQKLRDRLEQAGLNTAGRKLEFRVLSSGYHDENSPRHALADDDSSAFHNVIIAVISTNGEEEKEQERSRRLEDNYRFTWQKPQQEQQNEDGNK